MDKMNVLRLVGKRVFQTGRRSFGVDAAASKPDGWSAKESLPVYLVQIARKAVKHPFGQQIAEVFRLFAQLPVAICNSRRFSQLGIKGGVEGETSFVGLARRIR